MCVGEVDGDDPLVSTMFDGFTDASFDFFSGLEADNSRAYWEAHRHIFEEAVREPLQALLAALPDAYQPFKLFRPHRDLRFSHDKSPYKTQLGALSLRPSTSEHYLHLDAKGLFSATGKFMTAPNQLERLRRAVQDDVSGPALEALIARIEQDGYAVGPGGDPPLRTAPRGVPIDHPRIERLRWKGVVAQTRIVEREVLASDEVVSRIADFWLVCADLNDWLERHVGPSTRSPSPTRR